MFTEFAATHNGRSILAARARKTIAAMGSLESQAASVVLATGAQGTFDLQAAEAPRQ